MWHIFCKINFINILKIKKNAFNYATKESQTKDGFREVSGFALENGDYIVFGPSNNTRKESFNPMVTRNGKVYAKFEGKLYKIKSQFHTHPSTMKYAPGRIGVSKADLKLMFYKTAGNPMSILYRGNEWIVSKGNQFNKYGFNYSLKNNGSW